VDGEASVEELRNLGPKSGSWLRSVGIRTIGDLQRVGPVFAFQMVKSHYPRVSLNLLWAMAAGLKEKDWRDLDEKSKRKLLKEAELE
jgi:DNA transformation protein and related proteins